MVEIRLCILLPESLLRLISRETWSLSLHFKRKFDCWGCVSMLGDSCSLWFCLFASLLFMWCLSCQRIKYALSFELIWVRLVVVLCSKGFVWNLSMSLGFPSSCMLSVLFCYSLLSMRWLGLCSWRRWWWHWMVLGDFSDSNQDLTLFSFLFILWFLIGLTLSYTFFHDKKKNSNYFFAW